MDCVWRFAIVVLVCFASGCGGEPRPPAARSPSAAAEIGPAAGKSPSGELAKVKPPGADKPEAPPSVAKSPSGEPAKEKPPGAKKPAPGPTTAAAPVPAEGGSGAPSWKAWATALAGRDAAAKEAASARLEERGEEAARQLLGLLSDEAADVRRGAAIFLNERFDPADTKFIQAFSSALSDPDDVVRHIAVSVVNRFPPAAAGAIVPLLTTLLSSNLEDPAHRAVVVRQLSNLDVDPSATLPALRRAAQIDPAPSVRSAALVAVAKLAEPQVAVEALTAALKGDRAAVVRGLAAVRLGRLGAVAGAAAGDLAQALDDADQDVRQKAADALVLLGDAAVPPLADKLASPTARTRQLAVSALARLGRRAKPALGKLRERLADSDEQVRKTAEAVVRGLDAGGTP
jgi:HEAT repeat protein